MTSRRARFVCWLATGRMTCLGIVLAFLGCRLAAASPPFTSYASGGPRVVVTHAGEDYLRFGAAAWGPNWSWAGIEGETRAENGVAKGDLKSKVGGATLRLAFRAARPAPNEIELQYELLADAATDLTLFVAELAPGKTFEGRDIIIENSGQRSTAPCPLGRRSLGQSVNVLRLTDAAGRETMVRFEPACEITADGAARLVLARDHLPANAVRRLTVRVELPGATEWFASVAEVPDEPGLAAWYPWQATGRVTNSVLSLADWLEKPAGKRGRILQRGDDLVYDGKPIKLWGLNLCYASCAPEKPLADRRALFYSRYGINSVRLHKFADGTGWAGIQSRDSAAEYDPAGLDRMDYQVARFKEAGIYVKLSAHFGTIPIGPADRREVPFLEEFGRLDDQPGSRVRAPHSAFFYSPELQGLHIRQMVNLLKHRNPYTGLTYAEDPAVCAVEIINEQSILFYTSMEPLKRSATLRRQTGERFSAWLRQRYGSHDSLVRAWGSRALDGFESEGFRAGEHLDQHNILPLGNPWLWDPAQLDGSQAFRKRRLLDTLQFLYELQGEAYDRYVAAVREAGYTGEILGSNWQAGRAFSHYANLHSDARVGLIDRHNYFGGGDGRSGFNSASMLARAGSGSLSAGLQQVEGRAFMLSEWIHVFPNEWGVEGPAIIGAYGMGLQGWDVSYLFQNGDDAVFSEQLGRQQWDVMAPQILGLFPAVSRQVLRGDVRTAETVAARYVHVPSLFEGRLGFEDQVVQGYDDKELDGSSVPARALAVARCVVHFVDVWRETPVFDWRPYLHDGALVSSTKQLQWHELPQAKTGGYFTINTEGTKAVVGFAQDRTCQLDDVTITPRSRFGAIYVTALDREGGISTSRHLLVTALARARNTGMKFGPTGNDLLERGCGPVLMEPVEAEIRFRRPGEMRVTAIDHDGCRTETRVAVRDGVFTVDGARYRTPYYLIETGAMN